MKTVTSSYAKAAFDMFLAEIARTGLSVSESDAELFPRTGVGVLGVGWSYRRGSARRGCRARRSPPPPSSEL